MNLSIILSLWHLMSSLKAHIIVFFLLQLKKWYHYVLTHFANIILAKGPWKQTKCDLSSFIILTNCQIIHLKSSNFIFIIIIIFNFVVCDWKSHDRKISINQLLSTRVPWQAHWCTTDILKQAVSDYLVRDMDLFCLRLPN